MDYDYEITIEQALLILDLLDDYCGIFCSNDIIRATDYVFLGESSIFASEFN